MRRPFSIIILFLFAAGVGGLIIMVASDAAIIPVQESRPDIVLITVAPVGAEYLPCYGGVRNTTPYWCSLAKDGTLYERAYTPASWEPLALAAISTGRYSFEIGAYSENSSVQYPHGTLPVRLNASGYNVHITRELGRWHLVDSYLNFSAMHPSALRERHRDDEDDAYSHFTVVSERVVQDAGTLLGREEEPVFLWHHEAGPHSVYDLSQIPPLPEPASTPYRFIDTYQASPIDMPHAEYMVQRFVHGNASPLTAEERRYLRDLYFEGLWVTDRTQIRPVITSLKAAGEYESTMIIIAGLHGETLGENGFYSHLGPYDANVRVPLIIKYPYQRQGRRVSTPVSLIDLMPTLLEGAGIRYSPQQVTGLPLQRDIDRKTVFSYDSGQRLAVNATHKAAFCTAPWCSTATYYFRYQEGEDIRINRSQAAEHLLLSLWEFLDDRAISPTSERFPLSTRDAFRRWLEERGKENPRT